MPVTNWLAIAAIGLPLAAAAVIWLWRSGSPDAKRRLAATVLSVVALAALALFLLDRQYACVFATGERSCLFDGLASITLCLLALFLARVSLAQRGPDHGTDFILFLLLVTAASCLGLAGNLFQLIVGWTLLCYVLYRLLKHRGIRWSIIIFPRPDDE